MTFEGLRKIIMAGLFVVFSGAQPGQLSAGELPPAAPEPQSARPAEWAVAVMGGVLNEANFSGVIFTPWTSSFDDTQLLSATVSKRVHEFSPASFIGPNWFVEWEVGAGQRFGNSTASEFWTALYFRYDKFPWPDKVYMTAGASIGLNYATSISDLEVKKSGNQTGSNLLHYFAPEITVADPDNKDLEFVTRLHHRSGIFGLFNGVDGGSTFLTFGVRQHF